MKLKRLLSLSSVFVLIGPNAAAVQDEILGKELYDARCLSCHKEAPYGTGAPKAKSLDAVRSMTKLWANLAPGKAWSQKDLDDVVEYLNKQFYHY